MFRHVFRSGSDRCIAIAAGAVHSFTARRGERIVCRGGCILLSQFDVSDDFELHRGDALIISKHGLVVLEAIEASVLSLESVAGEENLQQAIQVALAAKRRAYMISRYFQQLFTLRRQ